MEPSHDVRLGWIQPQSVGSHPLFDVMDADSKAVNGYLYLADWHRHAHINLSVVGLLVDVQTRPQCKDQLFKLSSVQKVQQRPQYGNLQNTKQKQLLAG